jgi:hypothetical protein
MACIASFGLSEFFTTGMGWLNSKLTINAAKIKKCSNKEIKKCA